MITLYGFGPMFGMIDPSPFVMKAELLLRMAGVPYQINTKGFRRAPKGKLPYIDDEGERVTDSTFIRQHLERKYRVDFDAGYDAGARALAWAVEKMLEEHLYFAALHARWIDDSNFSKGPAKFFDSVPPMLRPMIRKLARRQIAASLHGHGMGRHSKAEIEEMGARDIRALSTLLGDKPYLLGDAPCGTDATAYAFVAALLCPAFQTPLRTEAENLSNLRAYAQRMQARYYA